MSKYSGRTLPERVRKAKSDVLEGISAMDGDEVYKKDPEESVRRRHLGHAMRDIMEYIDAKFEELEAKR